MWRSCGCKGFNGTRFQEQGAHRAGINGRTGSLGPLTSGEDTELQNCIVTGMVRRINEVTTVLISVHSRLLGWSYLIYIDPTSLVSKSNRTDV